MKVVYLCDGKVHLVIVKCYFPDRKFPRGGRKGRDVSNVPTDSSNLPVGNGPDPSNLPLVAPNSYDITSPTTQNVHSSLHTKPTPLTIIPELITEEFRAVKPSEASSLYLTPITVPISLLPVTSSHITSSTTDPGQVFSSSTTMPLTSSPSPNTYPSYIPSSPNTRPTYVPSRLPSITQSYSNDNIARNPAPYHATESSYFGGLSHFDFKNSHNPSPPDFRIPINYNVKSTQRTDQVRSESNDYFHVPDFKIPTVSQNLERPLSQFPQYPNQTIHSMGTPHTQNKYWGTRYPESNIAKPNMNTTLVGPRQIDRPRVQGYIPPTLAHPSYANRAFNQTLPVNKQWATPLMANPPSHIRNTRQKVPIALPPIEIPHSFVPIPLPRKMNPSADILRSRELHHSKYKGRASWFESVNPRGTRDFLRKVLA